jgi:hypothetical protein
MASIRMLDNTPPELQGDLRYAADKAVRDQAWDDWRDAQPADAPVFLTADARSLAAAVDVAVKGGYFARAETGDMRGASYFARLVANLANPEGDPAAVGALRKTAGGSNVEGYADDAVCGNGDPSDLLNVYDLVKGSGAPGASPTVNGPLPRRASDVWGAPKALSAEQMAYLGGSGVEPGPAPGLPAWESKHTELQVKLGQPSGALDPAWVRRVAEQLAFSFPNEGWGCKSADASRPQSGDVIARMSNGRLVGYQIVPPSLQPRAIDLSGQHFIPVSPTNHAGVTPNPTPAPTPTPTPTPVPTPTPQPPPGPDLEALKAAIQTLAGKVESLEGTINGFGDSTIPVLQRVEQQLEALASKPTVPPTIEWPTYRSDRLPVIGTITLRPQS